MYSLKYSPQELKEKADSVIDLSNDRKLNELINTINSKIDDWYKFCSPKTKIYVDVSDYDYQVRISVVNKLSNEGYRVFLEESDPVDYLVIDCEG